MKALILALLATAFLSSCASRPTPQAESLPSVVKVQAATPQEGLDALTAGNRRFVQNEMRGQDYHQQIDKTKNGQKPYAVVLSCLDSRVPVEIVFDQGIGELFVARVAGNIENDDILGSMEFGTAAMGAKLIVVLGHTKCGAVKGACNNVKLGHLTGLLKKIEPAAAQAKKEIPNFNPESYEHVDHASELNVKLTVERIRKKSKIIRDLEAQGKVRLVGAMYDISSGKVEFLPDQTVNASK
ncbi:carbonic anhydrase family protein [Bdellovibrio bacteriovorus]|uniref:carbonic anhydrase family protein n=1 Tax=Bdellovibrio bacteriovorus TaxID=959 RepID=UPI0021D1DE9E|nr:carbonic anhydrase family protein [Bdellovibrio bacteriovorus]UXR65253.1 carbonic anhydrase family protein [Bdellovibrio bacteriovorus]